MKHCETCIFWERHKGVEKHQHLGWCTSSKFYEGYQIALEEVPPDGVVVENDEGWKFFTGEKFGCIHHEAKDQ